MGDIASMDLDYAKFVNTDKNRVVITDGSDNDGFGAAFAAWNRFGDEDTEYTFYKHGGQIADVKSLVKDRDVIFSDLSLDYEFMRDVATCSNKMVVIDHHATSKDAYERIKGEYPDTAVVFDEDHSAAYLAWQFFNQGPPPALIKYVEDRDLWNFDLKSSDAVNLAIDTRPKTFAAWAEMAELDDDGFIQMMKNAGLPIKDYLDELISGLADTKNIVEWNGHTTAFINCGSYDLFSRLGDHVLQNNPEVDIALMWKLDTEDSDENGSRTKVSLRSRETDDVHVGNIASEYGGGGHAPAAGFSSDVPSILSFQNIST